MFNGFADHLERFRQPGALVGKHVAEVVEDQWRCWIKFKRLVEVLLGLLEVLLALGQAALQEEQVNVVFLFGG